MYKEISNCRVCKNENLIVVFSLGNQNLTGVFPKSESQAIQCGPVDLVKCVGNDKCGLVQLKQTYNLSEMYGDNYGYRSGLNQSMVNHLTSKVAKIVADYDLSPGDIIIDVGSNDGTTLKAYPENGFKLIGVDPSGEKFRHYYTNKIKLITDFFSAGILHKELGERRARVVTSFSMFYDLEDPIKFASEIESVLADNGIWIFEQSYLLAMLETNSFDTICQEHLEFYSLRQIKWIVESAKLKIIDVEFNTVNGGSFSITAAKISSTIPVNQAVIDRILKQEEELQLDNVETFKNFKNRVQHERQKFIDFLNVCEKTGKKVYGIGASTKGNVLLQYYGITNLQIKMIGEVNADKFGCFTPGTKIPLVDENLVLSSNPDYLVILPWHFKEFFINHPKFKGKELVFPLPEFQIIKN